MGIGEPHYDCLALVIFNLRDALFGRRLHLGDALPWRRFLVVTLALGVSSPRRRLMLTLSPDVDFDLDFVNARIWDGTNSLHMLNSRTYHPSARFRLHFWKGIHLNFPRLFYEFPAL